MKKERKKERKKKERNKNKENKSTLTFWSRNFTFKF